MSRNFRCHCTWRIFQTKISSEVLHLEITSNKKNFCRYFAYVSEFIIYTNISCCITYCLYCTKKRMHKNRRQPLHFFLFESQTIETDLLSKIIGAGNSNSIWITMAANFMIFHPRQKKINVNFPLVMENTTVKQAVETKFLCIIIDQRLCWKSHISFASKKISKTVGIIVKARYYLSSKLLLTLYFSRVYPYLTYRNVAWSSTYCSNLNCIHLLQKRNVWLISNAHLAREYRPII